MDMLHLMNVFVAVGEEEGFAAAARRLDLSPAAVTRAIAGLEEQLGVKLLLRTTRNVRLTEAGRRYLDDSRNILPCIIRFLQDYPEVEVSAFFLDRVVNLVEEGIDVAVRIGHLPDSSLKALRVGQVRRVLCASPAYLARHGVPRHPLDLQRHSIIAASGISPKVEWKFGSADDPTLVCIRPRLRVTSNDAAIDAVTAGLGISRLLSYQVVRELENGSLHIILADYEEAPWPVHVLHRESRFGSSKVRSFIDLLVEHLRAQQHCN
jgi:DNA-binding transcriptional LysR family regulator